MQKVITFIKSNKALSVTWSVMLVAALVAGSSFVFFRLPHYGKAKTQVTTISPEQEIQQRNANMIASVSEQIKLPSDEQPIIATVSDKDKLQNQDFFKQAQNGDKILMYPKNKKAFLYRPSINHVIAQAPLVYQDTSPAHQSTRAAPIIVPQGKLLYNNQ